jgi:hypothetical protein
MIDVLSIMPLFPLLLPLISCCVQFVETLIMIAKLIDVGLITLKSVIMIVNVGLISAAFLFVSVASVN